MSVFYVCPMAHCNKKYKTLVKLDFHLLKKHGYNMSEEDRYSVQPIDCSDKVDLQRQKHLKSVEAKRKEAQKVAQESEAIKQAAVAEHHTAEAKRYRDLEESRLLQQEEAMVLARQQMDVEKRALEIQRACAKNVADDTSSELCCICMEATRDTATIPCGHRYFCHACIEQYLAVGKQQCPFCRKDVLCIAKIYL